MLKKLLCIVCTFLVIAGCTNDKETISNKTVTTDVQDNTVDLEGQFIKSSAEIFLYLQNEEFEKLAEKVDPVEGISFSLFADFGSNPGYGGDYVNLSKEEIMSSLDRQLVWGYDDSDKEYKMTLKEYVQEILLKLNGKKVNYEKITFNESAFEYGGVINTIHKNYPEAKYVEYHAPGENGDNRPFQSIRFIFLERENVWYLIGISRDVATG